MATVVVETGHSEMIHDAQMDYYGKRLATASSDRTIRIFEVVGDSQKLLSEITGHDGPVWQVAWSHPQNGNFLASCSFDGKVIVWQESAGNKWARAYEFNQHEASVNAISWAPHRLGLVLAAASADGTVSVHTHDDQKKTWSVVRFNAHPGGVNAVSWAPDTPKGDLLAPQSSGQLYRRLVTGGCDNRIRLWRTKENTTAEWEEAPGFNADGKNQPQHSDWVRDVAWAPSLGLPRNTIASCSEDKTVIIWVEDKNEVWEKQYTIEFSCKVWKVSWSLMGNILAVSQGDNQVALYKESFDGTWKCLSSVTDSDSSSSALQ